MGVRENKIEKYLDECVTALGGITRKWVSPGYDGVPDRIVMINGRVWFVEVKVKDGVYGNGQEREHARLRKVGMDVCTVYGRSGVDELMKEISNTETPASALGRMIMLKNELEQDEMYDNDDCTFKDGFINGVEACIYFMRKVLK